MAIKNSPRLWLGLLFWSSLLTYFIYREALVLPFFFDDLDLFPYIERVTLLDIWRESGGFPYFRPLPVSIRRLTYLWLGENNAFLHHALNLVLHATNGLLVSHLAYLVWFRHGYQSPASKLSLPIILWLFLSSTFFILHPFAYQAVPWASSVVHLLVTTLGLISLIGYWYFRQSQRIKWLIGSLLTMLLALFVHESSVLVPLLIGLVELTQSKIHIKTLAIMLLWLLPLLIWFPIWYAVMRSNVGERSINALDTILHNTAYLAQGMTHPFTWLGGRLRDALEWTDFSTAVTLIAMALFIACFVQMCLPSVNKLNSSATLSISLLPWLWMFIGILPSVVLLDFGYVISGSRLLMLSSVGVSWLWADVCVRLVQYGRQGHDAMNRVGIGVGTIIMLVTLGQNYWFVNDRMHYYQLLGSAYRQATNLTLQANQNNSEAIFINLPDYMTAFQATYAMGHEGIMFMPPYIFPQNLVYAQTGQPAELQFKRFDDIRPNMPYRYGLLDSGKDWPEIIAETPKADVFVTIYQSHTIRIQPAGYTYPTLSYHPNPLATFIIPGTANETMIPLHLWAAKTSYEEDRLRIDLVWQVTTPPDRAVTIFVHLLDAQEQLIAQADGPPWAGTYPMSQWGANSTFQDIRYVSTRTHIPSSIRVGLYNWQTGQRYFTSFPEAEKDYVTLAIP